MKQTLQFLIDNICADFTVDSLLGLVRTCLTEGPAAIDDISRAIIQKDNSLDIKCAEGLAKGAVHSLSESGDVQVRGSWVYASSTVAGPQ